MASQALPVRGARLGKAVGVDARRGVRAAVLVLPAGRPASTRRGASVTNTAAARRLVRHLVRAGRSEGLVAHLVGYRFRGWNGDLAHPGEDAGWAADEIVRRYGDVPVCLVGIGVGGRAALHAAGHPAVESVVALAPWLPKDGPAEPVRQLIGRRVLIAHGTLDARYDPELSFRYAERAKKINPDVCRFEAHSDGHAFRQHRAEVLALTTDFTLGTLCARHFSRPVTDALAAPPPLGLRMPLAADFGRG